MSRQQHHKGKKRPRGWHRSHSSSRSYWRIVTRVNEMFSRAERGSGA